MVTANPFASRSGEQTDTSPQNGESMTLGQFRKKIKAVEPPLDRPSPRTRPIQNNDHADHILRLWTASGKIAK